jgi:hypothetical protein
MRVGFVTLDCLLLSLIAAIIWLVGLWWALPKAIGAGMSGLKYRTYRRFSVHIFTLSSLTELIPSREAANCAATQELPSIL